MSVALDHQYGRMAVGRHPPLPEIWQRDIASCQQGGEVGQRTTVRHQAREFARAPTDLFPQAFDHRLLGRRRPGAHVVDRHALIRDRTERIEPTRDRHRCGHLMADVMRMVQVQAAPEHRCYQLAESVDQGRTIRAGWRKTVPNLSGLAHQVRRRLPRQDRSAPALHVGHVIRDKLHQQMPRFS